VTRYDLFRRRIAPVAFVAAIALIAYDTCNKQDRTSATFVMDFGAAAPRVKAVDAEVWVGDDQLSTFHRTALDGREIGDVRFKQALPARDGEVRIDVTLDTARRHVVRRFHADDDAVVALALERDLAP
jgi:hypothetical protein